MVPWVKCIKEMTLKIAVDIDGVLADQVAAVLREIEREYGLVYSKSDVDRAHWTFEGREVWEEISRLLSDPEYVMQVPIIHGSQRAIKKLSHHDIFVVTARRPHTEEATRRWLSAHFPSLKGYYWARTGTKHNVPSDVLIDDLDINIVEFVKSDPDRHGILFQHPWSLNGTGIEDYSSQVSYCPEWESIVKAVETIDLSRQ